MVVTTLYLLFSHSSILDFTLLLKHWFFRTFYAYKCNLDILADVGYKYGFILDYVRHFVYVTRGVIGPFAKKFLF